MTDERLKNTGSRAESARGEEALMAGEGQVRSQKAGAGGIEVGIRNRIFRIPPPPWAGGRVPRIAEDCLGSWHR